MLMSDHPGVRSLAGDVTGRHGQGRTSVLRNVVVWNVDLIGHRSHNAHDDRISITPRSGYVVECEYSVMGSMTGSVERVEDILYVVTRL